MVTRTLGPFHFEDLEPHRFEDLVRNLIYDFRDWQALEATGRTGSDEGYDARGWERIHSDQPADDPEEAAEESVEARLEQKVWMIQCKREKELGPAAVKKIIEDNVDPTAPPYGYLLAAPVNFSKASQDAFRAALRERGVSEHYLWGKGEIEDQLLQPKNDRILFAFFGVSLVTRRRSRTTDVRSGITIKNKLLRALGNEWRADPMTPILLRDINDDDYPYKDSVPDFEKNPPWREVIARAFWPMGILVDIKKRYAYVNEKTKEFDLLPTVNNIHQTALVSRNLTDQEYADIRHSRQFHDRIPARFRAMATVQSIVRFEDVLVVDDKGDSKYACPHIFMDFESVGSRTKRYAPFDITWSRVKMAVGTFDIDETYKRVDFFPKQLPIEIETRRITDRKINLPQRYIGIYGGDSRLHIDLGDKGDFEIGDLLEIEEQLRSDGQFTDWAEAIAISTLSPDDCCDTYEIRREYLEELVGRKLTKKDKVRVVEFRVERDFNLDHNG